MVSGFGIGLMVLGALVLFLFWAVIIWSILWFANKNKFDAKNHKFDQENPPKPPEVNSRGRIDLEILVQRYAKGNISEIEFNKMRNDLLKNKRL